MDRRNSFTFLRLAFALAVVFSHSFSLGGFGADPLARATGEQAHIGVVAVLGFFIVSGFLITASAERSAALWRFAFNRIARILPGFLVMQLVTVFALAPAFMLLRHAGQLGYWDSLVIGPNSAISYLIRNAGLRVVQYSITDVFRGNPGGYAMNGSLWSLAPEMMCYVWLGVLTLLGGLRWKYMAPVLFVVVFSLHVLGEAHPPALYPLAGWLQKVNTYGFHLSLHRSAYLAFIAGMTCYQWRAAVRWSGRFALIALAALVIAFCAKCYALVWPFTLPYLVLFLAHRLPFQRIEKWGDFSYGIYIYAFPLQQCLASAGLSRLGFAPFFLASAALALGAGFVSWRWVEAPVLFWARAIRAKPEPSVLPVLEPAV
ncbi:MAG: hypothetical protein QOD99_168 [Chthoniobacter sp.]|jgi:peptidoglycan/LPS O-acetylase OafA/YrhL|nr:hypothetical protein [Chthoniobacter sp.]